MARRVVVAASLLTLSALCTLGACVADSNPLVPALDGGFEFDGALASFDGNLPELDATRPTHDAAREDATSPELDASGSNVEDAGQDTGLVDGGADAEAAADAGIDAARDAGFDAGHDAGVDSGHDSGLDSGSDANTSCITELFGDYYLRTDGTLVYYYNPGSPQIVMSSATDQPLKTVMTVSAQNDHACALLTDQSVWCWPIFAGTGNTDGDLGNGTFANTQAAFSASRVVTNSADAGAPEYLTGVIAMEESSATVYTHPTCVVRSDHTLWCWGTSSAQGSPPAGDFWGTTGSESAMPYAFPLASGPAPSDGGAAPLIQNVDQVSVSMDSLCYLTSGKVYCLGENVDGNLGNGAPGGFDPYPVAVSAVNGLPGTITALSSAYRLTCALGGGGVWCWGDDNWQQVGDPGYATPGCGACDSVPLPVQVALPDGGPTSFPDAGIDQSPLTNVTTIASGYFESCALDTAGALRCWGGQTAGVTSVAEATLYNAGTAPSTNIIKIALSEREEAIATSIRYLTASGVLVREQQVVTQVCP